jgi:hypothetical protein
MSIPKIIWAVWCDFKNKKDGVLNERLTYFKQRIISQHNGWQINIISSWDELIGYVRENKILLELLNNEFVGGAHKSDFIRFFLLNKFGGFWLDISTFLFTSLNIYYTVQPNATFIGYYTPPFMVEEIIFSSLGDMFDNVKYNEIVKKFKSKQTEYIKLNDKYDKYPFIPENFFIASVPNHPVTSDIFQQLSDFWSLALPDIISDETLCYEINKLMNVLASEIFDLNTLDFTLINTFNQNTDITDKKFSMKLLDNVWHCGYVFNYLQMYKAIVNYIINSKNTITQEQNINEFKSEYNQDLCSSDGAINACQNIVVKEENGNTLYLLSLSYNRLIKWANTMNERITFDNTYIRKMIDDVNKNILTKQQLIDNIVSMGIYQIKFSSWTRGSNIIEKFMNMYPVNLTQSGGKYKSRRNKKGKTKQNHKKTKRYYK